MGDTLSASAFYNLAQKPWQIVAQTPGVLDTVAVLANAYLAAGFGKKTLSELKDIYIDARLRYEGNLDYAGFLLTKPFSNAIGIQMVTSTVSAIVANNLMGASLIATAVRRPDLPGSYDSQYKNILGIVKDSLPDGYLFPMRFFVQNEKVPLKTTLAQAVEFLRIPFTNISLIPGDTLVAIADATKDPNPKPRRVGFVGMIGVPADRTLKAKQRSYLLANNRAKVLDATSQDLQRHVDTSTNPDTRDALQQFLDQVTGKKTLADQEVAGLQAEITEQGGDTTDNESTVPPDDAQATSDMMAADLSDDLEPTGVTEQVFSANVDAPAQSVFSTVTPGIGFGEPQEGLFGGIITNLFKEDFNDFRRTGIVMPINAYDQRPEVRSNKQRLASIYIADSKGAPMTGAAGKFRLPGPWQSGTFAGTRYNHFILTNMQEMHQEKQMVMDTLGRGWVGLMFGAAPEVWSVSGILINDTYSDQLTKFRDLWDTQIRGTQLAKNHVKMALDIPAAGVVLVGYPISLQMTIDAANNEAVVPFVMQILVSVKRPRPLFREVIAEEKITATALTRRDGQGFSSSIGKAASTASNVPASVARGQQFGPTMAEMLGTPVGDAAQAAQDQVDAANAAPNTIQDDFNPGASGADVTSAGVTQGVLLGREQASDDGTTPTVASATGLDASQTDGAYPDAQLPFAARGNALDPADRAPVPREPRIPRQPAGLPGADESFPNQPDASALE
jgi:hypothetical protein